jgi:hypothetical protein
VDRLEGFQQDRPGLAIEPHSFEDTMHVPIDRFYESLAKPITPKSRLVLALLALPLIASFFVPLWRISMTAPQYPAGIYINIFSYKVEGGNGGQDLQEVNTLNHYIGMAALDRAQLSDLDWLPFGLGLLLILLLRVAAVGNLRSLVDLVVMSSYFTLFAFGRFAFKLYSMGHSLNPEAPIKMPPFTPVVVGSQQLANFTVHSFPRLGSFCLFLYAAGLIWLTVRHLAAAHRNAEGPFPEFISFLGMKFRRHAPPRRPE